MKAVVGMRQCDPCRGGKSFGSSHGERLCIAPRVCSFMTNAYLVCDQFWRDGRDEAVDFLDFLLPTVGHEAACEDLRPRIARSGRP